jgi:hypothetical protein
MSRSEESCARLLVSTPFGNNANRPKDSIGATPPITIQLEGAVSRVEQMVQGQLGVFRGVPSLNAESASDVQRYRLLLE